MATLGSTGLARLWAKTKELVSNAVSGKADSSELGTINSKIGSIETEVSKKQDKLTFDDTPKSGSTNPVTSGGIYSAIQGLPTDGYISGLESRIDVIEGQYAKKSDITNMIRWKGSVDSYDQLPTNPEPGDTYSVEAVYGTHPAGTNWVWTGEKWDDYGNGFTVEEMTADDVDAICV